MDSTLKLAHACVGRTIAALASDDDTLRLTFEDGTTLRLADEGQTCCERRYMRTDDTLSDYVGATLVGLELRKAPTQVNEWGEAHDVQFLAVQTSKGTFVMSNHNEHNGYYGGFDIEASIV